MIDDEVEPSFSLLLVDDFVSHSRGAIVKLGALEIWDSFDFQHYGSTRPPIPSLHWPVGDRIARIGFEQLRGTENRLRFRELLERHGNSRCRAFLSAFIQNPKNFQAFLRP